MAAVTAAAAAAAAVSQSVECGSECAWTSPHANMTIQDMEFTFDLSSLPAWIDDVKKTINMDLKRMLLEKTRCLPPGFFVLR
jgi:hypothetical protein